MQRRTLLAAAGSLPMAALAHHGWSSFNQDRPLWLEGRVVAVRWQNPHAELDIEVPASLRLPADLATRALPAQTAPVDGRALIARAQLPRRKDAKWEIELAPLTRLDAWKVAEIKPGAQIAVLGFGLTDEKEAVVRAEYLFVGGKGYGLRSSPA